MICSRRSRICRISTRHIILSLFSPIFLSNSFIRYNVGKDLCVVISSVVRTKKEVLHMLSEQPGVNSDLPKIVIPDQFNAASTFLDRHVSDGRGSKVTVYHEGTGYTYAQIGELANRIGNGLLELGVDLEQRVA